VNTTNFPPVTAQRTSTPTKRRKAAYHHGNLRDALVDVAIELVAAHGVASFSLAEACRRLDVTVAAPYRHFADRDALLTAIAIRGGERLSEIVTEARSGIDDPADQLVAVTRAYVEFAAREPALFETMFTKEMLLGTNQELADAMRPVVEAFAAPAAALPGVTPHQTIAIVLAAASTAHGYASFLRAGSFAESQDAVRAAGEGAAATTRAIIAGRAAFVDAPEDPQIKLAGLTPFEWVDSYLDADAAPTPSRSKA
jgi:AcrR family transcriptional regulator